MFVRLFSSMLLFLLFVAGCSRPSEQTGEVSGKVTYKGKPLPGGNITFVSPKGYSGAAVISPQGEYQLKAPLGEVQIGVYNEMLKKSESNSQMAKFVRQKKERMKQLKQRAQSDEKSEPTTANKEVTGTYVPLPKRYADPTTSDLKYTVNPGSQTHDVELTD